MILQCFCLDTLPDPTSDSLHGVRLSPFMVSVCLPSWCPSVSPQRDRAKAAAAEGQAGRLLRPTDRSHPGLQRRGRQGVEARPWHQTLGQTGKPCWVGRQKMNGGRGGPLPTTSKVSNWVTVSIPFGWLLRQSLFPFQNVPIRNRSACRLVENRSAKQHDTQQCTSSGPQRRTGQVCSWSDEGLSRKSTPSVLVRYRYKEPVLQLYVWRDVVTLLM